MLFPRTGHVANSRNTLRHKNNPGNGSRCWKTEDRTVHIIIPGTRVIAPSRFPRCPGTEIKLSDKVIKSKWGIPQTAYLAPGRDGLGVWPDWRVVGALPPLPSHSASPGNWPLEQFYFLALNRSHMRDLGAGPPRFCVKFWRASLL